MMISISVLICYDVYCFLSAQIISQKDEHCWIGELNGLRGWFPAKFVELLDERSKNYSCAGDDSVTEAVMDLVRGMYDVLSLISSRFVICITITLFTQSKIIQIAILIKKFVL